LVGPVKLIAVEPDIFIVGDVKARAVPVLCLIVFVSIPFANRTTFEKTHSPKNEVTSPVLYISATHSQSIRRRQNRYVLNK
jgi:hypothetical protein